MSEQKQPEPLWSDERITAYIKGNRGAAQRGWTAWEVGDALKRVRDEYEAALAELEAKLIVVSRELTSTDNADRYYRGFNQGYDHAEALMQARIAELEAIIQFIDARHPAADDTCDEPGISFSEAVRRTLKDEGKL